MQKEKLSSWLILNALPGLHQSMIKKLFDVFGSPEEILRTRKQDLLKVEGISPELAEQINQVHNFIDIEKEWQLIEKQSIKIVTLFEEDYPFSLRHIYNPPLVLYLKGEIKNTDIFSIGIVGTRRYTNYGRIVCEKLSGDLAQNGVTIISGLARGIDTIAHRSALAKKGRTLAVLGSGLNQIYPPENKSLFEEIAQHGAVVSEFPMNAIPDRFRFPLRNRIISGLSLGIIVVEADIKSGALITASWALEQGREVFSVPGNINNRYSQGANKLIKQGAKLVEDWEDVIEEISCLKEMIPKKKRENRKNLIPELDSQEGIVFNLIADEPLPIDILIQKSNLPVNKMAQVLMSLEMKKLIRELPGKLFVKTS